MQTVAYHGIEGTVQFPALIPYDERPIQQDAHVNAWRAWRAEDSLMRERIRRNRWAEEKRKRINRIVEAARPQDVASVYLNLKGPQAQEMARRNAKIVSMYGRDGETYTSVGKAFGLSRGRVQQIVAKAQRLYVAQKMRSYGNHR